MEAGISDVLWKRKSAAWETALATVTAELSSLERAGDRVCCNRREDFRTRDMGGILYKLKLHVIYGVTAAQLPA